LREPTSVTELERGRRTRNGIVAADVARANSPPPRGLFQHQFAATQLSDDSVRVNFEGFGGVKQTFAIRGHVVELMYDAEENDEGSK